MVPWFLRFNRFCHYAIQCQSNRGHHASEPEPVLTHTCAMLLFLHAHTLKHRHTCRHIMMVHMQMHICKQKRAIQTNNGKQIVTYIYIYSVCVCCLFTSVETHGNVLFMCTFFVVDISACQCKDTLHQDLLVVSLGNADDSWPLQLGGPQLPTKRIPLAAV